MYAAVIGAEGRMGRELIRAIAERKGITLSGALSKQGSSAVGSDAGIAAQIGALGIKITDSAERAFAKAQVLLDFSAPEASIAAAGYAAKHGIAHIIGTTGFSPAQEKQIRLAAEKTVIVKSGNMSLGVNLLAALTQKAAKALNSDFDIEILEMHHRNKVDAPSGTALLLADAAAKGRGTAAQKHCIHNRSGKTGAREGGSIGIAVLRGGSVVGEHSVIFAGSGERLVLSHTAEQRGIFAAGAVAAALWTQNKQPGLYSMIDVLGLAE